MVQGTSVSLAPGGTLVVGNSSVVLPTQGPSAGPAIFEGGQGKLSVMGLSWGGAYVTIWMVLGATYLMWW